MSKINKDTCKLFHKDEMKDSDPVVKHTNRELPQRKNVWRSKQTFLSQTPCLLVINLVCDWSLYIRYNSNFHRTDQ